MAFIQRDPNGRIVGHSTCAQNPPDSSCLIEEELPDDHPEIVEFMKGMPILSQANMTADDFRREADDEARVRKEIPELERLALRHVQAWAQLETALSALLHTVLNGQKSHIAYAIYYGLSGFDARLNVVRNALIQLINESNDLEIIRALWTTICGKLENARDHRNTFAHGTIQTLIYNRDKGARRKEARISPLPFDLIRLQWEIAKKGRPRGFDLNEFTRVVKREFILAECLDSMNRVIANYRQFGTATFAKTTPGLEDHLKELSIP